MPRIVVTPSTPRALPRDVPTLFLLHFLGGSARTWSEIVGRLGPVVDCRGIDLPGFGDAAHLNARSATVPEMIDRADHSDIASDHIAS